MSKKQSSSSRARTAKQHASEQVEWVRVSLDEINLATFPVSVLDKKAQRSRTPLEFRDVINVAGRQVERHWKVFPHQEEGFPGPADDDVLMALFELTREQGGAKKIFFTRYQLCKKLGWPLNTFYYKRVESSFRKLAAVHIEATNAFGDQERKKFINMGFTIIQEYKLFDEAAGRERLSYVLWSDRIAASISQKLTKHLDASFYFDELETPLEKRLFRYLDNHFEQGLRHLTLNLRDLCYEHLGIGRRYRYTSQLLQKIEAPLARLVEKGFLLRWRIEGDSLMVSRAEEFAARVRISLPYEEVLEDITASTTTNRRSRTAQTERPAPGLADELVRRGVGATVAHDIARRAGDSETEVMKAISYFDAECARGKRFDNPAGLLVSLIRRSLPAEQVPPARSSRAKRNTAVAIDNGERTAAMRAQDQRESDEAVRARAELEYQEYLVTLGQQSFAALTAAEQKRLLGRAQSELQSGTMASKYRRMPAEKFAEHLRAKVETELSRAQASDFEQWFEQWCKIQQRSFR